MKRNYTGKAIAAIVIFGFEFFANFVNSAMLIGGLLAFLIAAPVGLLPLTLVVCAHKYNKSTTVAGVTVLELWAAIIPCAYTLILWVSALSAENSVASIVLDSLLLVVAAILVYLDSKGYVQSLDGSSAPVQADTDNIQPAPQEILADEESSLELSEEMEVNTTIPDHASAAEPALDSNNITFTQAKKTAPSIPENCRVLIKQYEQDCPHNISCESEVMKMISDGFDKSTIVTNISKQSHILLLNVTYSLLSSRKYNLLPGALKPDTCGKSMLHVYSHCLNWLKENGAISDSDADAHRQSLMDAINKE